MNLLNSMIMDLRGMISKSRNMWVITISLHSRRYSDPSLQKEKLIIDFSAEENVALVRSIVESYHTERGK